MSAEHLTFQRPVSNVRRKAVREISGSQPAQFTP